MYINRALLLIMGLAFIFLPAIEQWLWHADAGWYRPFLLWLAAVAAAWWNQFRRYPDEL
ncbi:hypothetical protein [Kineobactrum salinum]|uniref:Uncharacterized protein n=1 Tax=Kineobactrum salinum TaxID=2708301 RepID=A0A6C0TYL7_9GAMM|nr:hypothetical protein [Kineobactrum salinum]QIB64866.1 hypothetical protein G3T16_05140 [Kineobactrum salinum]